MRSIVDFKELILVRFFTFVSKMCNIFDSIVINILRFKYEMIQTLLNEIHVICAVCALGLHISSVSSSEMNVTQSASVTHFCPPWLLSHYLTVVSSSAGMTNRPDLIDDALMRPGRFEVKMEISECSASSRFSGNNLTLGGLKTDSLIHNHDLNVLKCHLLC